jgi:hypothetical protein
MSIAQKLSWEIVALNDRGDASQASRTALEVAYGVALAGDQPEMFSALMASIMSQVSDPELQRYLRAYTARGLKK